VKTSPARAAAARQIVEITDRLGEIVEPAWLRAAENVHRQLRPQLPRAYRDKMRRVFAGGGCMAVCVQGQRVCGVAVYRVYENTYAGVHMYVDDLVTDERLRSSGVGRRLLQWLERRAHAFYFREGMTVSSFHFDKPLEQ
jgi:GNAT superfamily N-acetyltransferase